MDNITINNGTVNKGKIQILKIHRNLFNILFIFSFIFSLTALILTKLVLANGGQEVAPVTSIAIYQYELAVELVFLIKWAFFFSLYYMFHSTNIIKTKGDAIAGTIFIFIMFFFNFVDMWNDILIYIYQL